MAKQRSESDVKDKKASREDGQWVVVSPKRRDIDGRFMSLGSWKTVSASVKKELSPRNKPRAVRAASVRILSPEDVDVGIGIDVGAVRIEIGQDDDFPTSLEGLGFTLESYDPPSVIPTGKFVVQTRTLAASIHRQALETAKASADTSSEATVLNAGTAMELLDKPRKPKKALLDLLDLH